MRVLMVSLSMLALAACGGRQVEVRTGPEPAAEVAIHLTNNLSQGVNVYVVNGASDIFVKQVAANSVEHIPVTRGQLEFEWQHLLAKVAERNPGHYRELRLVRAPRCHPLVRLRAGNIEAWERARIPALPVQRDRGPRRHR